MQHAEKRVRAHQLQARLYSECRQQHAARVEADKAAIACYRVSNSRQQRLSAAWVKANADVQSLTHVSAQQRAAVRERNFREALELLRAVDALSLAEAAAHQRAHQLRAGQALEARKNPPLHTYVRAHLYQKQALPECCSLGYWVAILLQLHQPVVASAGSMINTWFPDSG